MQHEIQQSFPSKKSRLGNASEIGKIIFHRNQRRKSSAGARLDLSDLRKLLTLKYTPKSEIFLDFH